MEQMNVSMAEAAKLIGVQTSLMQTMLETGEVPAWREGRNWKIPVSSLAKWNEERAIREAEERRRHVDTVRNHTYGKSYGQR